MLQDTDGTIVNLPGLPPMYDYEFFPQDVSERVYQLVAILTISY